MNASVEKVVDDPRNADPWLPGLWDVAESLKVDQFHARSSDHRPKTRCKLLHRAEEIHVAFEVQDRFVRCVRTAYQDLVSKDSCVEFFLEPQPDKGYFNFEINCGGTMLLYFIEDSSPAPDAFFRKFQRVPAGIAAPVEIRASLPAVVDPERHEPVRWTIQCVVPMSVLRPFIGEVGPLSGQQWRANFFKCGDETSHPHWASWSPIGERLRFHQPQHFAPLRFK